MIISLISYLLYSAYYIFAINNPELRKVFGWGLVFFYSFFILFIGYNIISNIIFLIRRRKQMIDPSMSQVRKAICIKIIMYILFGMTSIAYYIFSSYCLILYSIKELTDRQIIELSNIERIACLAVVLAITCIFHPCFFTASFQLSQFNIVILKT